jgi:signal transduction histidine kinase
MDAMTAHASALARWTAVAAAALSIALASIAIALDVMVAQSNWTPPVGPGWTGALPGVVMTVAGALVQWRLGWNPIAVILVSFGLLRTFGGLAAAWVNAGATIWAGNDLLYAALIVNQRLGGLTLLAVPVLLVFFPDGRLPRRPVLRALGVASIVVGAVSAVITLLAPWSAIARSYGGADSLIAKWFREPWGWAMPAAAWDGMMRVSDIAFFAGPVLAVSVLIGRGIGADLELRRQLRWIAWAGSILVAVFVVSPFVLGWHASQWAYLAATTVFCVAIVIAVTRYRLHSIDRVIGWTVLYGVLVVAVVLIDVVLLAVVGTLLGENTIALVSAIIVLIAFAPLREPMLLAIHRLVYGRRGDPYGVVAGLADSLEHADDADDQLEYIARSVARAFASPYVAVRVDEPDGRRLEAHDGATDDPTITLPLSYRGEPIGELELAPPRRTQLSRRDEKLLADVVRQAAAAVRATVLNEELQRSRQEIVVAREEERQRFRRDVHDGLGPALAAVKVRIDAARNVAARDQAEADRILATASEGVSDAVRDIRRIVHDLRPPTLDDLGLQRAIERVCEPLGDDGPTVTLDFQVEHELPPAIEVAAYRIASEALTNVRRHASARTAVLTLTETDPGLVIEVIDDGAGIAADAVRGVGLRSMRDRADELGGTLTVSDRAGGGTIVRAALPVHRAVAREVSRA